jgi:hypothetical protein
MSDADDDFDRPRKKKKGKPDTDGADRATSYAMGAFFFLLGIGLLVWYYYTQRAPWKLFNLLAGGGVAVLLSGIGLFIYPLDRERLHAFQNEPNPIAVFKIMPIFWKVWLLVILAAMIAAFIYVSQHTERIGR